VLDTAVEGADDATTCVVTAAPAGDHVLVHLANRSTTTAAEVAVDLRTLGAAGVETADLLWDADPGATNTADAPDAVAPRPLDARLDDGVLALTLPPVSWASVRCSTQVR
jgi:alpha-N-arabinofuranosidase